MTRERFPDPLDIANYANDETKEEREMRLDQEADEHELELWDDTADEPGDEPA